MKQLVVLPPNTGTDDVVGSFMKIINSPSVHGVLVISNLILFSTALVGIRVSSIIYNPS
jgi:hypothetical protein